MLHSRLRRSPNAKQSRFRNSWPPHGRTGRASPTARREERDHESRATGRDSGHERAPVSGRAAGQCVTENMRLFELPEFLDGIVSREAYVRWLQRKGEAHTRRDRKRGNVGCSVSKYKRAIHRAVCASNGSDSYTGEKLNWQLISTYNNDESKQERRSYKAKFALLPTVDHLGDGTGKADFKICGWRTNDAKGDLTLEEFVALCTRVVTANHSLQPTRKKPRS